MKFEGDVIITDPRYIIREDARDDWNKCNFGKNMEVLGINNYLCRNTIYGDWSCVTINSDTKECIGRFCADTGLVGVFLLDEVLEYNPDFDWYDFRPWTTTLIEDFEGDIKIEVIPSEDEYEDKLVSVIGTGNINFETHRRKVEEEF